MKKTKGIISGYLGVVAVILFLTAAIKMVGSFSRQPFMSTSDPLFPFLTRRQVLLCAAGVEIVFATLILRRRSDTSALWLLAWLSCIFGLYRAGLKALGQSADHLCPCLGYWLPLKYSLVNQISLGILLFLLVGTVAGLGLCYFCRPNPQDRAEVTNRLI